MYVLKSSLTIHDHYCFTGSFQTNITATNIINGCWVGYRTTIKTLSLYCCDNCQRVSRLLGYTNSFDFIELIPCHTSLLWCLLNWCPQNTLMYVIIRKINLKLICQSNNFIGSKKKIMKKKLIMTKNIDNNTQPMRVSSVHSDIAMAQLSGSVMSCYC